MPSPLKSAFVRLKPVALENAEGTNGCPSGVGVTSALTGDEAASLNDQTPIVGEPPRLFVETRTALGKIQLAFGNALPGAEGFIPGSRVRGEPA